MKYIKIFLILTLVFA
jgi:hypothetical protein